VVLLDLGHKILFLVLFRGIVANCLIQVVSARHHALQQSRTPSLTSICAALQRSKEITSSEASPQLSQQALFLLKVIILESLSLE
jgi:hypothetical protein